MQIYSSYVGEDSQIIIPKQVCKILGIKNRNTPVGFVVKGNQVEMVRGKIVPDIILSDDEISMLAEWSKKKKGKKTFSNVNSALKYLWRL